jgi:hypothetical protein
MSHLPTGPGFWMLEDISGLQSAWKTFLPSVSADEAAKSGSKESDPEGVIFELALAAWSGPKRPGWQLFAVP